MTGQGIDVKVDLKSVSAQLKGTDRAFAAALRKEVRTAVTESGSEVLNRARSNASWSTRIPGAIAVKTSFSVTRARAEMVTNARQAPHARPLELGSSGSGGAYNRHPVFGTDTRVDQPTRPFFFPAVDAVGPAAQRRMEDAIDKAARDAGFH